MAVKWQASGAAFAPEKRQWSRIAMAQTGNFISYDVAADGKHLIVVPSNVGDEDKGMVHVTFLFNFFDDLKRRVP